MLLLGGKMKRKLKLEQKQEIILFVFNRLKAWKENVTKLCLSNRCLT